MQPTLDRPETPARRRFDVEAYYRMADAGILSPKDRVEMIDGEIIEIAPIGSAHGGMTNRLRGSSPEQSRPRQRPGSSAPRRAERASTRSDAAAPARR
ncbi:MAG: hypothetical protein ACJ8H8_25595 [Geminicoccaceae bacterium]